MIGQENPRHDVCRLERRRGKVLAKLELEQLPVGRGHKLAVEPVNSAPGDRGVPSIRTDQRQTARSAGFQIRECEGEGTELHAVRKGDSASEFSGHLMQLVM